MATATSPVSITSRLRVQLLDRRQRLESAARELDHADGLVRLLEQVDEVLSFRNYQGHIFHYHDPKPLGSNGKTGQRNGRKARSAAIQPMLILEEPKARNEDRAGVRP